MKFLKWLLPGLFPPDFHDVFDVVLPEHGGTVRIWDTEYNLLWSVNATVIDDR